MVLLRLKELCEIDSGKKVWGVTQCVSAAGKSRTVESMASEGMGPDSPMLLLLTVWKRLAWLLRVDSDNLFVPETGW